MNTEQEAVTDSRTVASVTFMDEQEVTIALCYQQPFDTWAAEANAAAIVRCVNHADKLAEALSLAQATIERLRLKYDLGSVWGTLDVTKAALAAYESEAQS